MQTETLISLYESFTGSRPEHVEELPGAGSNRRYFRMKGPQTLIGVIGTSNEENHAFLTIDRHFKEKNLPVPEVYAATEDESCYLQEDLGDLQLFKAIEKGRLTGVFSEEEKELLRKTLRMLPRIQFAGADGLDFSVCYPQPEFNRRTILWDLNYFKYCFLKATGLEFQEDKLEDEFEHMAEILMRSASATFLYRDFQSRNVMIKDGEPYFIDFQGGRKGPFYYDVASFLWQAKANLPDSLRMELVSHYIDALREYKPVDETYFKSQLRHFVLFRTLQVLGAYGFRGYFEKKPHFIQSVPFAVENLRQLLKDDFPEYPYLCEVLHNLTELKQFTDERKKRQLTVKVMSFAYKKGIPEDPTGNGGGYVFDCRAVNNPGKYDRYKPYTGLDENVIRFLEEDGEITRFLEHVYALVDAHVQRYIERGFTNLSVCFGCTGGQHRSVYSAQHVAEHISRKFGVKVQLIHREQNIEQIFEAR
ncbi:phosphotransferase [Phocaeicola barnesiae]|uniref:RapZ C-terminal domain-containing protein n=1 Tax=Phocaeicola barnesiae TaxID=376804 RepID=UPI001F446AEE|nr:RNase adapter RapZ [Phocaeicola barnesiae]MCF2598612.1 phosphotransferase [Phocaeicola barnesiae]